MSPHIPRAKEPPHQDYPVVGPFLVMRGSYYGLPPIHLFDLTFEKAIEEFVRYGCPPSANDIGCGVLDRDGVVVIAWHRSPDGEYRWTGVRAALAELQRYEIIAPLMLIDVEKGVLK